MDALGQLPGWTAQPGGGLGGDELSVFQDGEEVRVSGERRGVSGGTGTGPGRQSTEVFMCDGSPLEGGVAPVVTRCASACDVPLSSRLSGPGSASPSLTLTSGLCVQYDLS